VDFRLKQKGNSAGRSCCCAISPVKKIEPYTLLAEMFEKKLSYCCLVRREKRLKRESKVLHDNCSPYLSKNELESSLPNNSDCNTKQKIELLTIPEVTNVSSSYPSHCETKNLVDPPMYPPMGLH
jgi:hypothetical protein